MEVVVEVVGEVTAERMDALYHDDLARSREVELQAWQGRPWYRRLLSWLFYRFRRFL
jgi:transposase